MKFKKLLINDDGEYSDWNCPECNAYNVNESRWRHGSVIHCCKCKNKISLNSILSSKIVYEVFKVKK